MNDLQRELNKKLIKMIRCRGKIFVTGMFRAVLCNMLCGAKFPISCRKGEHCSHCCLHIEEGEMVDEEDNKIFASMLREAFDPDAPFEKNNVVSIERCPVDPSVEGKIAVVTEVCQRYCKVVIADMRKEFSVGLDDIRHI